MKKKQLKNKKRPLTLLELLLVMSIVALAFSVCAFQIPKAFRSETLAQSAERLISKIELAQEVMLDYNADLSLTLQQDGKRIICTYSAEKGVPQEVIDKLNKNEKLNGIFSLYWNNELLPVVFLPFYSSHHECIKGELTLVGDSSITLFLLGHPGKILKKPPKGWNEEIVTSYPKECGP